MDTQSRFHVSVGDDSDHEDLSAEITFDGICVAVISQENGLEFATLDLLPQSQLGKLTLDLKGFLQAIEQAKKRLWELRKQ